MAWSLPFLPSEEQLSVLSTAFHTAAMSSYQRKCIYSPVRLTKLWSCLFKILIEEMAQDFGEGSEHFLWSSDTHLLSKPYYIPEMDEENMANNNSAPLLCHVKPPHKALRCLWMWWRWWWCEFGLWWKESESHALPFTQAGGFNALLHLS